MAPEGDGAGARRRALRAALSAHAKRESLAVVDPGSFDAPSTKQAAKAIEGQDATRTLVVLAHDERRRDGTRASGAVAEETCAKSFRNLKGVTVLAVEAVGVSDVVAARTLVASPAALERLTAIASPPAAERRGTRSQESEEGGS